MSASPGNAAPAFQPLAEIPRWLFLGCLVFAPWAYGCTSPGGIAALEGALAAVLLLWLAVAALRHLPPEISPAVLGCSFILFAWGWAMALNPHFRVSDGDVFHPVRPLLPWAPGTVDGAASIRAMLRMTCLLGTVCFVCDLSSRRVWRRRLWRTMALTGASLVLFGLLQSAFARPILLWRPEEVTATPYFATYFYHGNAGSFINLVLPLIAGLAALTLRKPDLHLERALWFPGLFICVAGAFVNVSRSAMVITILLCVAMLAAQFMGQRGSELLPPRRLRLAYLALMAAAIAALVAFSGWERPAEKWSLLRSQLNSNNKRLVSTEVCLRMLPAARWHGFGPGTFESIFPHYTGSQAMAIPGIWRYAHDDYLQALIEWGWLGSLPLGILFFGAIAVLVRQLRRRRYASLSDRVLAFASALALAGVAIHATMDFPLQIASLQLYVATFMGLGWGSTRWTS